MAEASKYTEAKKKGNRKWDAANLDRLSIAAPKGRKDAVKAHAEARGESVNGFINRAIDETMERDCLTPDSAPERPGGGGGIHLPPEALKTAQSAAEAAKELLPDFVSRAIENQAQRDKVARKLGKG